MSGAREPKPAVWGDYTRELGVRLHQRRVEAGLSQKALADLAVISRFRYQQLESGGADGSNPTLLVLVRLANALEVDVADLIPPHRHVRG